MQFLCCISGTTDTIGNMETYHIKDIVTDLERRIQDYEFLRWKHIWNQTATTTSIPQKRNPEKRNQKIKPRNMKTKPRNTTPTTFLFIRSLFILFFGRWRTWGGRRDSATEEVWGVKVGRRKERRSWSHGFYLLSRKSESKSDEGTLGFFVAMTTSPAVAFSPINLRLCHQRSCFFFSFVLSPSSPSWFWFSSEFVLIY